MTEIDLNQFRCLVAAFPAKPPRTVALEQRIKIGTGFHNKWYSSQREHWLGWLALKAREIALDSKSIVPSGIWTGLKCSPMLYWAAEVAGANSETLDQLEAVSIEAARIRSKDGNPHGVEFRKILPWTYIAPLLIQAAPTLDEAVALKMGDEALGRLITHLPKYRKYLPETEVS